MAMGTQWKKDPLSLVREYTIKNDAITLDDKTNELVFGSTRYSKAMLTAYMSSDQGNDGSKKNYTLDQIWLFATKVCLEGSSGAEYVKECAQKGIPPIPFKDRKDLKSYLSGETDTTPLIGQIPLEPVEQPVQKEDSAEPAAKKQKVAEQDAARASTIAQGKTRIAELIETVLTTAQVRAELSSLNPESTTKPAGDAVALASDTDVSELCADESVRVFVEADTAHSQAISANERGIATRSSVLQGRQSLSMVLDILDRRRKRVDQRPEKAAGMAQKPAQRSRYDQHVPEQAYLKYTGLEGAEALNTYQSNLNPTAPADKAAARPPDARRQMPRQMPIVLVPSVSNSLVNMFNIKQLLDEGKYVSLTELRANGEEPVKPQRVTITRPMGIHKTKTTVMFRDDPLKLSKNDWDCVVAVFASKAEWQFKGWPYKGGIREILDKLMGVHVLWEDDKVDAKVAEWNLHHYRMKRNARHLDGALQLDWWAKFDKFVSSRKGHLIPSKHSGS